MLNLFPIYLLMPVMWIDWTLSVLTGSIMMFYLLRLSSEVIIEVQRNLQHFQVIWRDLTRGNWSRTIRRIYRRRNARKREGTYHRNKHQPRSHVRYFTTWNDNEVNVSTNIHGKRMKRKREGRNRRKHKSQSRNAHIERLDACFMATTTNSSEYFRLAVDNHCSQCISNDIYHFVSFTPKSGKLQGIKGSLSIEGIGTVKWAMKDVKGFWRTVTIENVLYVPKLGSSFLSPQHWTQMNKDEITCITNKDNVLLNWDTKPDPYQFAVTLSSTSNTATMIEKKGSQRCVKLSTQEPSNLHMLKDLQYQANNSPSASSKNDENLNFHRDQGIIKYKESFRVEENLFGIPPNRAVSDEDLPHISLEREWLQWHHRLNHMSSAKMKLLTLLGWIPRRLGLIMPPSCAVCHYGSQTRRPWHTKAKGRKIHVATRPGECVSFDQMESTVPGFIAQMKGNLTKNKYHHATVFIDHYLEYGFVYFHTQITTEETIKAKKAFEAHLRTMDVMVEHYHTDNGRFSDKGSIQEIHHQGQTISFCGVNAHWQNERAERRIRDLGDSLRRMMVHANKRWPQAMSTSLWPYAFQLSNELKNDTPTTLSGETPRERLSGISIAPNLNHYHTFGCPLFALHNNLQNGKSIPKWSHRSRLGMYLGNSPRHAGSVSLVLNLHTARVSPQFHVGHDDAFATTRQRDVQQDDSAVLWKAIAKLNTDNKIFEYQSHPMLPKEGVASTTGASADTANGEDVGEMPRAVPNEGVSSSRTQQAAESNSKDIVKGTDDKEDNEPDQGVSCSGRVRRMSSRMRESVMQQGMVFQASFYEDALDEDIIVQEKMSNPIAFKASNNLDILYYHQAMAAPDADMFRNAMVDEINAHCVNKHWKMIPIQDLPKGARVLDSVWAFQRNRSILTRKIHKWKARLNVHGGQQILGIDYDEVFSPVVANPTTRLILILCLVNGWNS